MRHAHYTPLSLCNPLLAHSYAQEIQRTILASRKAPHVVYCYGWSALKPGQLALVMRLHQGTLFKRICDRGVMKNVLLNGSLSCLPTHTA